MLPSIFPKSAAMRWSRSLRSSTTTPLQEKEICPRKIAWNFIRLKRSEHG